MALIALAVTLGTPNASGQVPITTSNLAASIAQAVADLTTLSTSFGPALTNATAADTDVATVQTDATAADGNVATALASATTVDTNCNAIGTALDALATGSNGIVALFSNQTYNGGTRQYSGAPAASVTLTVPQQQAIIAFLNTLGANQVTANQGKTASDVDQIALAAGGIVAVFNNQTYNVATKQYSGVPGASATLTTGQQSAVVALLNTTGTDQLAEKVNTAAVVTQLTTTKTSTALVITDAATAKAATLLSKNTVAALSTATVAADLTAAQAIIASANVYIQTDGTVVTNVALLNGALVNALTFVRDTGILPT